jgi:hypothetical protein
MRLALCDEIGNRIAGFTIRDDEGRSTCVKSVDQIQADAWASRVDLLVWLSRSPEFWGEAATSATFKVWADGAIREMEITRAEVQSPVERYPD